MGEKATAKSRRSTTMNRKTKNETLPSLRLMGLELADLTVGVERLTV